MPQPPSLESLIWDARARIMWGESTSEVTEWLKSQGVEQQRIDEIIQTCQKERDLAVRKRGINEVVIGSLCVVACVGIVIAAERIAVWNVLGAFFGAYLVISGVFKLMQGGSTPGSLTDM